MFDAPDDNQYFPEAIAFWVSSIRVFAELNPSVGVSGLMTVDDHRKSHEIAPSKLQHLSTKFPFPISQCVHATSQSALLFW